MLKRIDQMLTVLYRCMRLLSVILGPISLPPHQILGLLLAIVIYVKSGNHLITKV